MKTRLIYLITILLTCVAIQPVWASDSKASILFDAGHAVDAGNADWVIEGAYSEFATLLRDHGFTVVSTKEPLTLELLQKHQALVLPEPNSIFSPEETKAIIDFINLGGGVYFIGDHIESDRNRDGIDSVGIFNQFVSELGFRMEDADILEANLSDEPVKGEYKEHPVTYKVKAVASWAGTSIEILDPERVQGVIFFADWLYGQPAVAVGTYGKGRFVASGDSAIFDDGSGTRTTETRHKGFFDYDHKQLALNIINWLTGHPAKEFSNSTK